MIAKNLMSNSFLPVKFNQTGLEALHIMSEHKIFHIPVVNESEYIGLLAESEIYDLNKPQLKLNKQNIVFSRPYVSENNHVFEVVKNISSSNLSLIPVLNNINEYIGCISLFDLNQAFAKITGAEIPGSIIIVYLKLHKSLNQMMRKLFAYMYSLKVIQQKWK